MSSCKLSWPCHASHTDHHENWNCEDQVSQNHLSTIGDPQEYTQVQTDTMGIRDSSNLSKL